MIDFRNCFCFAVVRAVTIAGCYLASMQVAMCNDGVGAPLHEGGKAAIVTADPVCFAPRHLTDSC